jgi:hypothetical protein
MILHALTAFISVQKVAEILINNIRDWWHLGLFVILNNKKFEENVIKSYHNREEWHFLLTATKPVKEFWLIKYKK